MEEILKLVIETAYAGVSQMPRHRESEAEKAVCMLDRLVKEGWRLTRPGLVEDTVNAVIKETYKHR